MGGVGLIFQTHYLRSLKDTQELAHRLVAFLSRPAVIALSGPLGAGKTAFVQAMGEAMGISERIQSPTFTLLYDYGSLAHFDLYRMKDSKDFLDLGFDEYLFGQTPFCAIEWPERISDLLPKKTIWIDFEIQGEQERTACISQK